MGSCEFLQCWTKFKDARATDLIKIDFSLLYPLKEHLLYSKFQFFKKKIERYYGVHIHNEYSKQLFAKAKSTTNKDAQDYIYLTLLNAVLPSTGRFKTKTGKKSKKVTIVDAQESLVLRLVTINDYQRQIDAIINKYFSAGLTVQPFLIVEGSSDMDIRGFFVFFDHTLFKLNSFVEALDICFKIFHVLNLEYPPACRLCWIFVQQFFFEINTHFDYKSSNITSLSSFLNTN